MMTEKNKKRKLHPGELALHLMLIPGLIYIILFQYIPMYGIVIAFQKFQPANGLFGPQKWVGWGNFEFLLSLPNTLSVLRNTVIIAFWKIVLGLVVPIIVALMLNEMTNLRYKKVVQTVIYFPHFISWIIMAGIMVDILSPSSGIVNKAIKALGGNSIFFLGDNRYFRKTMIVSDIWKNFGYGTIVYLAAITNIDPTLYEAASIDGANRWQQMIHVTLPGMRMIIALMMVLSLGNVLNAGFDQIFNLYSPVVYETGDILDTFIYRLGIESAQFGPASAAGLFKSIISMIFITTSYLIADKAFDYRLF